MACEDDRAAAAGDRRGAAAEEADEAAEELRGLGTTGCSVCAGDGGVRGERMPVLRRGLCGGVQVLIVSDGGVELRLTGRAEAPAAWERARRDRTRGSVGGRADDIGERPPPEDVSDDTLVVSGRD